MSDTRDQVLALAGVAQFALYAHEIAAGGSQPAIRLQRALHAIFCTDPEVCDDVFSGLAGTADGRRFLRAQLQGTNTDPNMALVSRYIGQILRLSARLQRDSSRLQQLRAGIERARAAQPEQALEIIDEIYRQTISSLRPRIMIQGRQDQLDNPRNAEQIRCFLLAAVRCAILWRQCNGNLWQLFLQRKRLTHTLAELEQERQAPKMPGGSD